MKFIGTFGRLVEWGLMDIATYLDQDIDPFGEMCINPGHPARSLQKLHWAGPD